MKRPSSRINWWTLALTLMAGCGTLQDACFDRPAACPIERCSPPRDVVAECGMVDGEPNGDLPSATVPPEGTRCETTSDTVLSGVIGGDGDVDVYRSGPCPVSANPTVELLEGSDPDLNVCVYFVCEHGSTSVSQCYEAEPADACVDGSNPDIWSAATDADYENRQGFRGCCRKGVGRVTAAVECGDFLSNEVDAFIWIEPADTVSANACLAYEVAYRI